MIAEKQMVSACEWQCDGLVGPTHNYAGLAFGNVASDKHKFSVSNPCEAALQGIAKMRHVKGLGVGQIFFIPHYRPLIPELKRIGFSGSPAQMIENAFKTAPELLASLYSASAMWVANAATVAPSADTGDGKLHFTPANLLSKFHRAVESGFTTRVLKRMFSDERYFTVHDPLPSTIRFSDEGAANHMRVTSSHGQKGVHLFIYGMAEGEPMPTQRYPARQHKDASMAVARLHQLDPDKCLYFQQSPAAIDAGVFHHDVIGLNSLDFMVQHEWAIASGKMDFHAVHQLLGTNQFRFIEVREAELPIAKAVSSYFFNSQLVTTERGIEIIAPIECSETLEAKTLFDRWVDHEERIAAVHYLDVRESMKNGGGPACLRLRIVMTEAEAAAMHQGVVLTDEKADQLEIWVKRYYRDRLSLEDLRDPLLISEIEEGLDALSQIVGMEGIYPFQT